MKILFVNWAPLWRGAQAGGGVNVYVQAMAVQLAQRGHKVNAVNAGYSYDFLLRSRTRFVACFQNINCYEIINSPVIAPGFFNASRPLSDVQNASIEALFQALLDKLQPDIVHFNNIEGFSGHCIQLAKQSGARVIYSLHNYHPLCSQVNLLYQNRTLCTDFQHGQRCVDCLPKPPTRWRHQLRRRFIYYLRDLPGLRRLRSMSRKWGTQRDPEPVASTLGAQSFRQRREQLIQCLNKADLILAVSHWVRDVYVRQGLDSNLVKVNHIGSAIASISQSRVPPPSQSRNGLNGPIRLCFMGVAGPHKGLPLLLQALAGMHDTELDRIDLALYALGVSFLDEQLHDLSPRLAALQVQDGYQYTDIPRLLAHRDLGIAAPIWWDNAPQVVFEYLALGVPVIGAKIGGIPDFVTHNSNGLLFEPGNADDLAAKLRLILADPSLIERLRKGIKPIKTLAEHVHELEAFYSGRSC